MTTANLLNIETDQGSSINYTFIVTNDGDPFDFTGWDARMQVRATYGSVVKMIDATITNGKLTFGADRTLGFLKLQLEPDDTSGLVFSSDDESIDAVYDVELVDVDGIIGPVNGVYKAAKGTFTIDREVTRD